MKKVLSVIGEAASLMTNIPENYESSVNVLNNIFWVSNKISNLKNELIPKDSDKNLLLKSSLSNELDSLLSGLKERKLNIQSSEILKMSA